MSTTTPTVTADATQTTTRPRADCGHPLWGALDGLPCVLPTAHAGGHVYHDPHGSAYDDRHLDGGHG